jgi:hypothetical protein
LSTPIVGRSCFTLTASVQDLAEYGEMIPVTLIDGVQHDFWRVDERRLRQALES